MFKTVDCTQKASKKSWLFHRGSVQKAYTLSFCLQHKRETLYTYHATANPCAAGFLCFQLFWAWPMERAEAQNVTCISFSQFSQGIILCRMFSTIFLKKSISQDTTFKLHQHMLSLERCIIKTKASADCSHQTESEPPLRGLQKGLNYVFLYCA